MDGFEQYRNWPGRPKFTFEQHAEPRYNQDRTWVCRGCLGKELCQWEPVNATALRQQEAE